MRAGLRERGGAAGRCQRIGTGLPSRPLESALITLRSVTHHPTSVQERSVCVVGSEGGSLRSSPSFISDRHYQLCVARLDRRMLLSLKRVCGSASAERLRSLRKATSTTRHRLKIQSDTDMHLALFRENP